MHVLYNFDTRHDIMQTQYRSNLLWKTPWRLHMIEEISPFLRCTSHIVHNLYGGCLMHYTARITVQGHQVKLVV